MQAYAIQQALVLDPVKNELVPSDFIKSLMQKMAKHEVTEDDDIEAKGNEYCTQLEQVAELLAKEPEPSTNEVVNKLGHHISAQLSVPTAIYSFLRSEQPDIKEKNNQTNPFRMTLEYAINLGGDTDTIASMACAIAGAYYGDVKISKNLLRHCEDQENITKMADQLFRKVVGPQ